MAMDLLEDPYLLHEQGLLTLDTDTYRVQVRHREQARVIRILDTNLPGSHVKERPAAAPTGLIRAHIKRESTS